MKKKLILLSILTFVLVVIGLGLWLFMRLQAATTCQDIMVYQEINYSGVSACLAPGQYTAANLQSKGIADNSISSIKIPSGSKLTIYSSDNYSGDSKDLTSSVANLSFLRSDVRTWNERISSLKIIYITCPSPSTENRTLSCPSPQTGSITQTRTKSAAPSCAWSDWQETSNTCQDPVCPQPLTETRTISCPPPQTGSISQTRTKIAPPSCTWGNWTDTSDTCKAPVVEPTSPKVNLKVNDSDGPITIDSGNSVKLSWVSSNAKSCVASNGWSGSKPTQGQETTGNLTTDTIFVLTCSGNGSAVDSAIVTVKARPESEPEAKPTSETALQSESKPEPEPGSETDSTQEQDSALLSLEDQYFLDQSVTDEDGQVAEQTEEESMNSAGQEAVSDPTENNNWIYIIVILVVVGAGTYLFIKIKRSQLTSEDLLKSPVSEKHENEVVLEQGEAVSQETLEPDKTEPAAQATIPPVQPLPPASTPGSPLPPSVPAATNTEKAPEDMSID